MNKIKLFSVLLAMLMTVSVYAENDKKDKGVYIAGVSASFSDSIVYITDIQLVKTARVVNYLLEDRDQYSSQLKDYLSVNEPSSNRTCFVYFDHKKKNLEKQMKKLRERYAKSKSVIVKDIPESTFQFTETEEY